MRWIPYSITPLLKVIKTFINVNVIFFMRQSIIIASKEAKKSLTIRGEVTFNTVVGKRFEIICIVQFVYIKTLEKQCGFNSWITQHTVNSLQKYFITSINRNLGTVCQYIVCTHYQNKFQHILCLPEHISIVYHTADCWHFFVNINILTYCWKIYTFV